jgi:hypothetical protein
MTAHIHPLPARPATPAGRASCRAAYSLAIGLKSFLTARPDAHSGRDSCRAVPPTTGGEPFEITVCMTPVLIIGGLFMVCLLFVAFMGAGCAFPGSTQVINIGWRSAQAGSNATNRVSSGADLELPLVGGK